MKTLLIALVGLFLTVSAGAEEPTTAPAIQMIADVKNGSVEIAGEVFAFGTSADALVDHLGKPDSIEEREDYRWISYSESLGFSATANALNDKLREFSLLLRIRTSSEIRQPEDLAIANVKTVEGIGAGSTQEQIEKVYGEPEDRLSMHETFWLNYAGVTFYLDKDGLFLIEMHAKP